MALSEILIIYTCRVGTLLTGDDILRYIKRFIVAGRIQHYYITTNNPARPWCRIDYNTFLLRTTVIVIVVMIRTTVQFMISDWYTCFRYVH
jgi:hypothetical protein